MCLPSLVCVYFSVSQNDNRMDMVGYNLVKVQINAREFIRYFMQLFIDHFTSPI